jgi:hypothetical protein
MPTSQERHELSKQFRGLGMRLWGKIGHSMVKEFVVNGIASALCVTRKRANPSLCRKFQARIMPPNPKCLLQICTAPKLLIPSESVVLIPTPKLQKQTLGTLLI